MRRSSRQARKGRPSTPRSGPRWRAGGARYKVNAFLGTDLEHTLDQHGVEALTIVGSMSHMCIDAATRAAADLGYAVTVAHDACATLPLEFDGKQVPAADVHGAAMAALAFAYAKVVKTDELIGN